ncbi:Leucine-rich repeat [Dillenia turbinata]|uniref:Leucine-rich repeat n=1 Tax=Dillenia turbinata TaxID=194707 RepID=A0AAN8Z9T5_9MAGN
MISSLRDDGFCPVYSNHMDSSLLLSLAPRVDVYLPPRKRSRISGPFLFKGDLFVRHKPVTIDVLPDECLFEIFRRLPAGQERSACASVSKRWLMLLGNVRREEFYSNKASPALKLSEECVVKTKEVVPLVNDKKGQVDVSDAVSKVDDEEIQSEGFLSSRGGLGKLRSKEAILAVGLQDVGLTAIALSSDFGQGFGHYSKKLPKLDCFSHRVLPFDWDEGIASLFSSTSFVMSKVKLQGLNITDVSLAVVGHYGKAVTDLVLSGLQNVRLEAVSRARSLESLQLEECHRISQFGVYGTLVNCGLKLKSVALVSCLGCKDVNIQLPMVSPCKSLHSLSIRNCPGIGDATLAVLGKLCPQLRYLDLSGLGGITDAGFLPLLESCEAGLVKVTLGGCVNLTDKVVSLMAQLHGSTLELLNLDGCKKITDTSLVALAETGQVLSDLDVSKCGVSDFGVASLACAKQLNLQILCLSGCSLVSDKSFPYLVKLGQTLFGLNIQHCNALSSSKVDLLLERLWQCDILF